MIRRSVSAALLVRDGFSGQTLPDGSGTRCLLDGRPVSAIWKKDGYLVLTDLEAGAHTLSLLRHGYREETISLTVGKGFQEGTVSLKPGPGYRFPASTARLSVTVKTGEPAVPLVEKEVWTGITGTLHLKLAQDKQKKQTDVVRVFCQGSPSLFPAPGWFLVADTASPELVYVRALHTEEAELAEPMTAPHSRGKELVPVQPFRTDGEGKIEALFRQGGTVYLFYGGSWKKTEVQPGEQSFEWIL